MFGKSSYYTHRFHRKHGQVYCNQFAKLIYIAVVGLMRAGPCTLEHCVH